MFPGSPMRYPSSAQPPSTRYDDAKEAGLAPTSASTSTSTPTTPHPHRATTHHNALLVHEVSVAEQGFLLHVHAQPPPNTLDTPTSRAHRDERALALLMALRRSVQLEHTVRRITTILRDGVSPTGKTDKSVPTDPTLLSAEDLDQLRAACHKAAADLHASLERVQSEQEVLGELLSTSYLDQVLDYLRDLYRTAIEQELVVPPPTTPAPPTPPRPARRVSASVSPARSVASQSEGPTTTTSTKTTTTTSKGATTAENTTVGSVSRSLHDHARALAAAEAEAIRARDVIAEDLRAILPPTRNENGEEISRPTTNTTGPAEATDLDASSVADMLSGKLEAGIATLAAANEALRDFHTFMEHELTHYTTQAADAHHVGASVRARAEALRKRLRMGGGRVGTPGAERLNVSAVQMGSPAWSPTVSRLSPPRTEGRPPRAQSHPPLASTTTQTNPTARRRIFAAGDSTTRPSSRSTRRSNSRLDALLFGDDVNDELSGSDHDHDEGMEMEVEVEVDLVDGATQTETSHPSTGVGLSTEEATVKALRDELAVMGRSLRAAREEIARLKVASQDQAAKVGLKKEEAAALRAEVASLRAAAAASLDQDAAASAEARRVVDLTRQVYAELVGLQAQRAAEEAAVAELTARRVQLEETGGGGHEGSEAGPSGATELALERTSLATLVVERRAAEAALAVLLETKAEVEEGLRRAERAATDAESRREEAERAYQAAELAALDAELLSHEGDDDEDDVADEKDEQREQQHEQEQEQEKGSTPDRPSTSASTPNLRPTSPASPPLTAPSPLTEEHARRFAEAAATEVTEARAECARLERLGADLRARLSAAEARCEEVTRWAEAAATRAEEAEVARDATATALQARDAELADLARRVDGLQRGVDSIVAEHDASLISIRDGGQDDDDDDEGQRDDERDATKETETKEVSISVNVGTDTRDLGLGSGEFSRIDRAVADEVKALRAQWLASEARVVELTEDLVRTKRQIPMASVVGTTGPRPAFDLGGEAGILSALEGLERRVASWAVTQQAGPGQGQGQGEGRSPKVQGSSAYVVESALEGVRRDLQAVRAEMSRIRGRGGERDRDEGMVPATKLQRMKDEWQDKYETLRVEYEKMRGREETRTRRKKHRRAAHHVDHETTEKMMEGTEATKGIPEADPERRAKTTVGEGGEEEKTTETAQTAKTTTKAATTRKIPSGQVLEGEWVRMLQGLLPPRARRGEGKSKGGHRGDKDGGKGKEDADRRAQKLSILVRVRETQIAHLRRRLATYGDPLGEGHHDVVPSTPRVVTST